MPGHVAPAALDFRSLGEGFASLAPAIDQPFFIGDGLDAAGAAQAFLVPDAARVLVLGVLDATAFHGSPDALCRQHRLRHGECGGAGPRLGCLKRIAAGRERPDP